MVEKKIDRRKIYYLVLDIETANMANDALAYDVGFAVCDKKGNIYEEYSFVIRDIFTQERTIFNNDELMSSAYYANKLPLYYKRLKTGEAKQVSLVYVKKKIRYIMQKYNITQVAAYNALFDKSGLDRTLRYITKSKIRWFFPYGTKIVCIWHMACQVICTQKTFLKWAIEKGYQSEKGNIQTSAEVVYRYLTRDEEFSEEHTGLADVRIEAQILAKCLAQHKKMNKDINRLCWRIPTKTAKEKGIL